MTKRRSSPQGADAMVNGWGSARSRTSGVMMTNWPLEVGAPVDRRLDVTVIADTGPACLDALGMPESAVFTSAAPVRDCTRDTATVLPGPP